METLYINGKSLQFKERKFGKNVPDLESFFKFQKRIFVPFKSEEVSSSTSMSNRNVKMIKRNLADTVEHVTHRRKVLKRPKRFKNYYTDREPLSISCFEFPRFVKMNLFHKRHLTRRYLDISILRLQ